MNQRPFLIGTDWWTDVDDVVAMRIFARSHKTGRIRLQGVCINACMEYSCPSLDAFLQGEGLPSIPIGIDRNATGYGGKPPYQKRMAQSPGAHRSNGDCTEAVRLYRQALAEEASVEIAEIGFCQVLAALLRSPPDDLSPLPGHALLAQNCKHIWSMAGRWDDPAGGYEYNLSHTRANRRAASDFYENCPVPVTFLGFEVGLNVISGDVLKGRDNDLLAQALKDHGSENGRHSWDPMLALLALAGDPAAAGYRAVYGQAKIDPGDGKNQWIADGHGSQRYVVKTRPDDFYRNAINAMIL